MEGKGVLDPLVHDMWWLVAMRGVVGLVFGLMALVWPPASLVGVLVALSVYALLDGLVLLDAAGCRHRHGRPWGTTFVEGACGIAFFVVMVAWPVRSAELLWDVAAGWAMVSGSVALFAGGAVESFGKGAVVVEAGVMSVLLGVWMMASPVSAAFVLAFIVAAYAIVSGAMLLRCASRMYAHGHRRIRPAR